MNAHIDSDNDYKIFSLTFDHLVFDPANIVSVFGYPSNQCPDHILDIINNLIGKVPSKCNIQGGYKIFNNVERLENKQHYRVENVNFDIGKIISTQLRKAHSVALFVCTIGSGLESWANKLIKEGDFIAGYIVDAIASETVDLAMDVIQDNLEKDAQTKNEKITNRYSPGYCGWQVSEQHKLFSLLPENFCNITLTDSALMVPIKSVSGIIGIGQDVKKVGYTCQFCDKKDCIYRRKYEKQD